MGKEKLTKMAAPRCDPDTETECPGGCCPEANWFCCPDSEYCAATEADCPMVSAKEKLTKMAARAQCEDGETDCGWCCPEANWFCCDDGEYCAETEEYCPFVSAKEKLTKMAAPKCDPETETECPTGCCPNPNWICCPDSEYCAGHAESCPTVSAKEKLTKMAAPKCGDDETECPGGCCPEANWTCCPDGQYCAATAADCPFIRFEENLIKMAKQSYLKNVRRL